MEPPLPTPAAVAIATHFSTTASVAVAATTSVTGGLCLHSGIAPQLSGRISATQLCLQASSAQQQYIAVLQSRFVRRRCHLWPPQKSNLSARSAVGIYCAGLLLSCFLVFVFTQSAYQASPFFCVASSPTLIEQWKLLSSRIPEDSSDSRTAIVPSEDPAPASSQLDVVLNCQLFTQAITEAVILCKYSR